MDQCKLCFVLLLPVGLCLAFEVTLDKTVGKEPDVTKICAIEELNSFSVACTISDRSRGKQCRLLYRNDWGLVNQCDPKFELKNHNQTVFLILTSLTPADSGNYTCECSRSEGTHIIHLNITVEEQPSSMSSGMKAFVGILVAAFIIVPGVVVGRILGKKYLSYNLTSEVPGLSVCEAPCSLDHPDDSYKHLQYPANDIYQNVSVQYEEDDKSYISTADFEQETDEEADQNCNIYENL